MPCLSQILDKSLIFVIVMYQEKVQNHLFICSLRIFFSGSFSMLYFGDEAPRRDMRFYETIHKGDYEATKPYFSKGSFSFSENSSDSAAGDFYRQQASFRFPSNDRLRSQRISNLQKVTYIEMILNDGSSFIMGRNDIQQNRRPKVETSSSFHMTEVKISTESILPVSPIYKQGPGDPDVLLGYDYTYNFELS